MRADEHAEAVRPDATSIRMTTGRLHNLSVTLDLIRFDGQVASVDYAA